jgi:hypothetical protein
MASKLTRGCGWMALQVLFMFPLLIVFSLIPMPWSMLMIPVVMLLMPVVMWVIWHGATPEQRQRWYSGESSPPNQKGPLN